MLNGFMLLFLIFTVSLLQLSLVLILTKATRNKVSRCDHFQPQTVFGINDSDQY